MQLHFTKMHGLGNDFVVIDATRTPFRPDSALLARLTERRYGVGCDQVLVIDPPPAPEVASGIDFGYRVYNADGSEVSQCGNGARCLAAYVAEHGLSDRHALRLRTRNRTLELLRLDDGQVRVDMGAPRFETADIPLHGEVRRLRYELALADGSTLTFGAASMGNPHALIEVTDVETAPVAAVGEQLQHHAAFPERVNVGFIQFIDESHARLRVYERGAGETLACGSGACAAMAIGRLWGRLGPRAEIAVRGGVLLLEWTGGDASPPSSVFMTGPATTVFEGSIAWLN